MFFNKAAFKHWEKLTSTLSEFVVSLHRCSDMRARSGQKIILIYFSHYINNKNVFAIIFMVCHQ